MKVLVLSNKFPYPATDGSSIAIMSMLKLMLINNYDIHVLSLNTLKHKKDPSLFKQLFPDIRLTSVDINTNITPVNAFINLVGNEPFHVSRFFNKDVARVLLDVLRKEQDFDIVLFEGIFMAPYLTLVKQSSNAQTVVRLHNVEHKIWERQTQKEKNPILKWYLNLQSNRLKKYELEQTLLFDGLIPISPVDGKFFKDASVTTLQEPIPCGINVEEYNVKLPKNTHFFYIGAFDWMPNLQGIDWFLDEVWPIVIKNIPKAQFFVAGRHMPQQLKNKKITGVNFIGEVNNAKVFIQDHGIFVIPLLSGSGIRIKIIEGLAYGKTMVTTSVGAEGIQIDEKSIVIADSPQAFAERMISLYSNPELVSEIGTNARNIAESFYSEINLAKRLNEFYLRLL